MVVRGKKRKKNVESTRGDKEPSPHPVLIQVLGRLIPSDVVYRNGLGCQTEDCEQWDKGECANLMSGVFKSYKAYARVECPRGLRIRSTKFDFERSRPW
jgi:hypothetical protein